MVVARVTGNDRHPDEDLSPVQKTPKVENVVEVTEAIAFKSLQVIVYDDQSTQGIAVIVPVEVL